MGNTKVKGRMEERLKNLQECHKLEEVHRVAKELEEEYLGKISSQYEKEEVIAVVLHAIEDSAKRNGGNPDLEVIKKELVDMSFEMFSGLILTGIHLVSMFQAVERVEMQLTQERGN